MLIDKKYIKQKLISNWIELLMVIALVVVVFALFHHNIIHIPIFSKYIIELGAVILLLYTLYIIFSKTDIKNERIYIVTGFLTVLLVLLPICVLCITYEREPNAISSVGREMTSMAIDYCAIIASLISVIFVAITLVLQRKQLKRSNEMNAQMIDNQVLSVIDKFLAPDMLVVRDTASQLRDNMRFNKEATVKGLRFAFERQIRDDYYKNRDWCKFKESEAFAHYAAFTRLMRFFDMISLYQLSETTAKSVHFYYVWWRSFMVEVRDIFVEVWESVPEKDRHLSFMPNWVYTIKRLDDQLESHNLKLE